MAPIATFPDKSYGLQSPISNSKENLAKLLKAISSLSLNFI